MIIKIFFFCFLFLQPPKKKSGKKGKKGQGKGKGKGSISIIDGIATEDMTPEQVDDVIFAELKFSCSLLLTEFQASVACCICFVCILIFLFIKREKGQEGKEIREEGWKEGSTHCNRWNSH